MRMLLNQSYMLNRYNLLGNQSQEKYYMKLCLVLYFEAYDMIDNIRKIEDTNLKRKQKIQEFKETMYKDII